MTWKEFKLHVDRVLVVLEADENVEISSIEVDNPQLPPSVAIHIDEKGEKWLEIKEQQL